MKRELLLAGALWAGLTVVGELLAVFVDIYPTPKSDKAEDIDTAFRFLVYAAVPVFTFVIAVLVYSVMSRRIADPSEGDGPPIQGRGAVPLAWFGITAGLTLMIMIYPGLISIPDIVGDDDEEVDLVVEVTGFQWQWSFTYPEQQIDIFGSPDNIPTMVLPLESNVRFNITSVDVLHSFWVPAFQMKIDAVPGKITSFSLRPTEIGDFDDDPLMRVQCAELCGLQHSRMWARVEVVTVEEFEEWAAQQGAGAAPSPAATPVAGAQQFSIVGENIAFDLDEIVVEGDRQVAISFDNRDAGVLHNWALYESEEAAAGAGGLIAGSTIQPGPVVQTIPFDPPDPGSYFYRCDVHPTTMTGTLVVR
jgi:cytochrome c oxidase subunit 2